MHVEEKYQTLAQGRIVPRLRRAADELTRSVLL
jgi:hypothetical protein